IAPLSHEEIPDRLEILCDRDQRYGPFHTSGYNAHLHVVCTRDAHHSRNGVMYSLKVRQRDFIAERRVLKTSAPEFAINDIGTDAFNLCDNVALPDALNRDDPHGAPAPH